MPQRSSGRMAHPRSSGRGPSEAPSTVQPASSAAARIVARFWVWLIGPVGQQLLSLVIIAFGLLTIFTIWGINSGRWVDGWARMLVFLFGWGAYPVALFIVGLGLLWLRHLVHKPTSWRWRPFLGFELTLIALLTLTHTFLNQYSWHLVELGQGGGVVGWALYVFFSEYVHASGTAVLMTLLLLFGLGLAFDLTREDLKVFVQRLLEVWDAARAQRAASHQSAAALHSAAAPQPAATSVAVPRSAASSATTASASAPQPAVAVPSAAQESRRAAPPPLSTPYAEPELEEPAEPAKADSDDGEEFVPPPRDPALPPMNLLKKSRMPGMNPEDTRRKSRIIEETLAQFGVPARVTEVRPGPTVTQFGVSPGYMNRGAEGDDQRKVRVSQIASLADDLALALAAKSLRVEAPVPGRAVVGIEVPNEKISPVSLRAVLDSEEFHKCCKPLCFAVGMDVAGTPVVADLSVMPHLLVAGTTGSGKSVFVKALAASLVMHNTPDMLRLLTIDPKMVELSHLNGLPHLLGPTETTLEDIIRALRWVAHEMDERYKKFSTAVARNLDDYNRKLARQKRKSNEPALAPLPRIVVLIDELADLMMAAPEETERTLTRIAQMARATGIHLVVATQRPSTDVVTGLIKANFPARVSFATTSTVDSRVIIDTPGAESLLGKGDMLFLPPDASAPLRIQGCHITDHELEAIIAHWQSLAGATPAKAPWKTLSESKGPEMLRIEGQSEDADLLEQAINLAKTRGKISTSGLQRRLRISYPRAARLMEEMERMGLVGPQESAGRKRQVILGDKDD
ncbi:MAG: DNA translocase FtsK 4TM domain-containing protein [Anaerolineae bacterium]|nr:DNA translocase FtsK 4TM domain-containing protein [Anaerolineae bacterium]